MRVRDILNDVIIKESYALDEKHGISTLTNIDYFDCFDDISRIFEYFQVSDIIMNCGKTQRGFRYSVYQYEMESGNYLSKCLDSTRHIIGRL